MPSLARRKSQPAMKILKMVTTSDHSTRVALSEARNRDSDRLTVRPATVNGVQRQSGCLLMTGPAISSTGPVIRAACIHTSGHQCTIWDESSQLEPDRPRRTYYRFTTIKGSARWLLRRARAGPRLRPPATRGSLTDDQAISTRMKSADRPR